MERTNDYQLELKYLNRTIDFIEDEIYRLKQMIMVEKSDIRKLKEEVLNYAPTTPNNFDRLVEVNPYINELKKHIVYYNEILKNLKSLNKMVSSPYFGRFDFVESGSDLLEKIYIGLRTLRDPDTFDIIVYDWRAPISSVFYRFEKGRAFYEAPDGIIEGDVVLKRQYKIENQKLKYYFDCNVVIDDEILREALGRNSTAKMRTIVETIQKEQDKIIRDVDGDVLVVQGVAGSGKTSIALHRIAYLLYFEKDKNLKKDDILIISPNKIFSQYIKNVLPELGEENVNEIIFEDFVKNAIGDVVLVEERSDYVERLSSCEDKVMLDSARLKNSSEFIVVLDRLLSYYERNMIEFKDVYYDGKVLYNRYELKNEFLNDKMNRPIKKRLKRLEMKIFDKIHPFRKERLSKIERFVEDRKGHEFEVKAYSRFLSIKEMRRIKKQVNSFTDINFLDIYRLLFADKDLFKRLSSGLNLDLSEDFFKIAELTCKNIDDGKVYYEDIGPILYLKYKVEGVTAYKQIKHVVIDEAQDYSQIFYEIFKLSFRDAKFTILGDVNQTLDKGINTAFYDLMEKVFAGKRIKKFFMGKSYRSTYEINEFSIGLLKHPPKITPFERHGDKPQLVRKYSFEEICRSIANNASELFADGYKTIGVIAKTKDEADRVYDTMKNFVNVKLLNSKDDEVIEGINIITPYGAKGLEFDVAFVFNASSENYRTEYDRNLLYIACTRALHKLVIYSLGDFCKFIG
ncbi:UvrD-helicase domain-containing protein [Thermoanaerobacterium saccharolyticum]|uniref:HelD family protein n=1 Tax=Thermoanaerobacterium saccharolyticum TaxID=28896 RepID=UPI002FD8DD5B